MQFFFFPEIPGGGVANAPLADAHAESGIGVINELANGEFEI